MSTSAHGCDDATVCGGGASNCNPTGERMVTTAEPRAQALRSRPNAILGSYARIVAAEAAAKRVWQLAFTAKNAHHAGSVEEATCALRALDFATDQMSDHVEHALLNIAAERAA